MEISNQIKKFRTERELSQDKLAEKIFVSRQTISNWENDKNYPDLKSLLLLSTLFDVSLDILIKGDIEKMKAAINPEDIKHVKRNSKIMRTICLILIFLPLPLCKLFISIGNLSIFYIIYALFSLGALIFSFRTQRYSKNLNIHTYKEVVAIFNGKELNEAEKNQEYGKRTYQKIFSLIVFFLLVIAVQAVYLYFLFI